MRTIITRRKEFPEHKIFFTTQSFKHDCSVDPDLPWNNCLYIHLRKSDYPQLNYPQLTKDGYFDYYNSDLGGLDWHWGITFYEEMKNISNQEIYVKAGCDYLHLYDDDYRREDCGEMLLKYNSEKLLKEFLEIVERRNNEA